MNTLDRLRTDYETMSSDERLALEPTMLHRAQAERAEFLHAMLGGLSRRIKSAAADRRHVLTRRAARFIAASARRWQAFAEWRQRRRGMAALMALSDHTLKDIGVSRSEIFWAAHHGRDRPPAGAQTQARPVALPIPASPNPAEESFPPQSARDSRRAA